MTDVEMLQLQKAAMKFKRAPNPTSADALLIMLGPHRKTPSVAKIIDDVLDYKFLVGAIPTVGAALGPS